MGITLEFERSLQAVNPQVAVPYWDFTLESTFYDAWNFRESGVFADDWLGAAAPRNGLRTVDRGRWAYTPVMTNAREFSMVTNPYGLLRAPWNTDPTPFLTRADMIYGLPNDYKPSGCADYAEILRRGSWPALALALNTIAHGHLHETLGGTWHHEYGQQVAGSLERAGEKAHAAVPDFGHAMQGQSKRLWRAGYLECPAACSMDTPADDCMCSCPRAKLAGKEAYEILLETGVFDSIKYFDGSGDSLESVFDEETGQTHYTLPGMTRAQAQVVFRTMLQLLCNPGHIGDMFQSTSTNDPVFWVLHPTVERIWTHHRLGATALSDTLPPGAAATEEEHGAEATNVASAAAAQEEGEGGGGAAAQPVFYTNWDDAAASEYNECYGHRSGDLQPFPDLLGPGTGHPTNRELYDYLDPANPELPYVYGSLRWAHCERLGFDMSNAQAYTVY